MKSKLIKVIKNNKGQALIEFGLMLPLFVIVMIFLIIIYDLTNTQITVQENIRYEVRKSIDLNAKGKFRPREKTGDVFVEVPGRMKNILEIPFISQTMKLSYYEGCYQGLYKNKFRKRYLYRQIE